MSMLDTVLKVLGVIVGATAICASIYVSWRGHKRSIMPVLVFLFKNDVWILKNVGAGPALNLLIARQLRDARGEETMAGRQIKDAKGEIWMDLIQCYPLASKDTLTLSNYDRAFALGAVYTDAYGQTSVFQFLSRLLDEFQTRKLLSLGQIKGDL